MLKSFVDRIVFLLDQILIIFIRILMEDYTWINTFHKVQLIIWSVWT